MALAAVVSGGRKDEREEEWGISGWIRCLMGMIGCQLLYVRWFGRAD